MDRMFEALDQNYSLEVIYSRGSDDKKSWSSNTTFRSGKLASELSNGDRNRLISKAQFVIVGGWGEPIHRKLILSCLVKRKAFAIFSDAPNILEKTTVVLKAQQFLLKAVPFFFVSGVAAGREFARTYGVPTSKIRNFPYFATTSNYGECAELNSERQHSLNALDPTIRILIANNFIPRKGYDVVFGAMKKLHSLGRLNQFEFSVAGTGEQHEFYKAKFAALGAKVEFLGWVSPADYLDALKRCDVLLHASHFEPYGVPPVDAYLAQKTVVASSGVYSARDLVSSMDRVHLFEAGNSEALAAILSGLADSPRKLYGGQDASAVALRLAPYANLQVLRELVR